MNQRSPKPKQLYPKRYIKWLIFVFQANISGYDFLGRHLPDPIASPLRVIINGNLDCTLSFIQIEVRVHDIYNSMFCN